MMGAWPPQPNTWQFELMKASFSALVATLTLVLTWFVGQRLTARWSLWQKRRESELAIATAFDELYGEFLTVWRLWRAALPKEGTLGEDMRWSLIERIAAAEGKLEAMLVKLANERRLTDEEIRTLGLYRQAYRMLRFRIRSGRVTDLNVRNPEYHTVKKTVSRVGMIIRGSWEGKRPSREQAGDAFMRITLVRPGHWEAAVAEEARHMDVRSRPEPVASSSGEGNEHHPDH